MDSSNSFQAFEITWATSSGTETHQFGDHGACWFTYTFSLTAEIRFMTVNVASADL